MKYKSIILEKNVFQEISKNNASYEIINERSKYLTNKQVEKKVKKEWDRFSKEEISAKNNLTFFSNNQRGNSKKDYVFMREFKYVQSFSRTNLFKNCKVEEKNLIPLSSICLIQTKDKKFIFGIKENMDKKISGFSGYMIKKDLKNNKINLFEYLLRTIKSELNLDEEDINKIFRIGNVYANEPLDKKGLLNNRAKNNVFLITLNKTSSQVQKKFKSNFQFKDLINCEEKKLDSFLLKNYEKMSIHCIGALYILFGVKSKEFSKTFPKKVYEEKIFIQKKKVLITGVSGFIGSELANHLNKNFEIIGIDIQKPLSKKIKFYKGSITNESLLERIFKENKIDIIIHSAAEKSLKNCENNKKLVYKTNYLSTKKLYEFSKINDSKFIFISSDIVFNGIKGNYSEDEKPSPINQYGRLKQLCENFLINKGNVAICRTALVFGRVPRNQKRYFNKIVKQSELIVQGYLVDHVLKRIENNLPIFLAKNEYCNPTSKKTLAKQIMAVIQEDTSGIIHCCGKEKISKFNFGKQVAKYFKLNSKLIKDIISKEELRPKNVSLKTSNSEKKLKIQFPKIMGMIKEEYNENF
jgi:dTDP-4-dehydrorhamnose reductase